jgi:putative endonuclease
MGDKKYYFYIMTNILNTVIYVGVTNNLERRTWEHKNKLADGFTKKYNVSKLVYYEIYDDPISAIKREKQVKGGSRQKKIDLIKKINSTFRDLYSDLFG